ncbi:MAG: aspartate carbamoyltransferase catalytic subunit [Candidatus Eisenbacteria bacterium]|nr:aspartate carbamoyltransferase catalytic subunit [Candidatus Eisenbacteria bacterium]
MKLARKDLLGLEGAAREEIELILNTAGAFKEVLQRKIPKVPTLRGKTAVNLFFEASTRTRVSFELAEKRLSADSVSIAKAMSSAEKGETLLDTVRNLQAMKIDFLIVRHSAAGAPHFLASRLEAAVINAGDGAHEHPTQGLLDLFTVRERFGSFEGLRVVIVGDVLHSRVARSNVFGLRTVGARVTLCAPRTFLPKGIEALGVEVETDVDRAIEGADVVMVLRIQKERQDGCFLPTLREYAALFGINRKRADRLKPGCLIMHPGPINRGVEIEPEVADGPRSVILDQVTNGVAVRMAVIYLLSGGEVEHGVVG